MQLPRIAAGLLCASLFFSTAYAVERVSPDGKWTFDDHITIPTLLDPFDPGSTIAQLPANIFVPSTADASQTFPAIIYISSWAVYEHQYLNQAQLLADKGYVVLSYTARGFHSSPGLINTAGEADVNDARSAIDYLLDPNNHLPVDPERIAMGGVSYGAGISLLAAMQDERVKVVTAMSGWGDLIESLWGGNTPDYTWLEILTGSSKPIPYVLKNRPDPLIEHYYGNMRTHTDVAETKAWGMIRSPISYIDQANARVNPPALFMSNNLHDYLFQPDSVVRMLHQYQGPWRLELNRGTHASTEANGLLGNEDNRIWVHATQWLDHYLKDEDNGIDQRKRVNTIILNTRKWESYPDLPVHDQVQVFQLNPHSGTQRGSLDDISLTDTEEQLSFDTTDYVTYGGWVTGALDHTSRTLDLNKADDRHGLLFNSTTLTEPLRLRGEAKVKLWAYLQDKSQYFAYLFYLNPETGKANWVGHAPFSCHHTEGCGLDPDQPEEVVLDFFWTAVDLPAGSQVLLVIDGNDPDYWRYDQTPEENHLVISPEYPASLELPVMNQASEFDDPVVMAVDTSRSANGAGGDGHSFAGGALGWLSLLSLLPLLLLTARRRH